MPDDLPKISNCRSSWSPRALNLLLRPHPPSMFFLSTRVKVAWLRASGLYLEEGNIGVQYRKCIGNIGI